MLVFCFLYVSYEQRKNILMIFFLQLFPLLESEVSQEKSTVKPVFLLKGLRPEDYWVGW
jgi:hypothetical protein